ncbi:hypothetical protein GGD64_008099 [Bradyrhizobium sp. CIR3A]|nr:hypothetical protein [Bradyrhizobium sp. CIR3A]
MEETLTCFRLLLTHSKRRSSSNMLQRLNEEIGPVHLFGENSTPRAVLSLSVR